MRERKSSSVKAWTGAARTFLVLCTICSVARAQDPVTFEVRGLEGKPLENVQEALSVPPGLVREGKVDRDWLDRLAGRWRDTARRSLEPFGYYEAIVRTEIVPAGEERYRVVVDVTPGEPVRVTEVRVKIEGEGAGAGPLRRLVEDFPLRRGDVLLHDEYEKQKGTLLARAQDLGYLDAKFSVHEIRVNREERSAQIDLSLATGPRYFFGEVEIRGGEDYPDPFLRRYLAFRPGESFSYGKLWDTQLNYRNSDRFKEVAVTAERESAEENRIPVTLELTQSPPKRLRPGVGYGTDTGARFTLRYRDVNAFHRGHAFESDLYFSQVRQTAGAKYTVPDLEVRESETSLKVGLEQEDTGTYLTRSALAEIERLRAFSRGRTASLYLRVLFEDFTVGTENEEAFLVLPGARYSKRRFRGPAIRPRHGFRYELELRGTDRFLGSTTGLVQLLASGNALVRLPARFSTYLRLDMAYTEMTETLDKIPISLRFFAGGDQSVRGYAYQSLGPKDENGEVIGGRNLFVGSVEIERAIGKNGGVAVFYDAGNAFNAPSGIRLFQGAGIGIRYYTPVGPIRLDLARQIDVPDPSFRVHLGLGFAF